MVTVYHATPYEFSELRAGSWVSTSKAEACLHLLMKNTSLKFVDSLDNRLKGYVITMPDFDASMAIENVPINDVVNYTTNQDIVITQEQRQSMKEAITTLPENKQWVFFADDIVDLTTFLQQEVSI